ncbi:sensor histidine kinase [Streptomyces sp. NPDC058613]|uniref:sensor histidine kinase n=1 Tax=unclassified Streptomyces TaxID=2593676 RepID=UPI0036630436
MQPIMVLAAVCGAAGGVAAAVACGLGLALRRARAGHRTALEERGWLLEREREGAARTAVDAERARIAAELHDIVSHNVSMMVVQAGAAREVLATMPEEAAGAMAAVERAGRNTMTELRHLLGLLAPAQDGSEDPYEPYDPSGLSGGARTAPQPSLSRLSALIDRFAFAGLPVDVRISGDPRPLPTGIDVTAYRIVQEALTNALKHGDGSEARVTVRYADHALRVEVLNGGPSVLSMPSTRSGAAPAPSARSGAAPATAPAAGRAGGPAARAAGERPARAPRTQADGTGRGLVGLHERVAVYGGDLDARRRLGGGYRVRARLPLDRP